jgi:hypothetical protein
MANQASKPKAAAKPRLSTVERLRAELEKAEAKQAERQRKANAAKHERLTRLYSRRAQLTLQIEALEAEVNAEQPTPVQPPEPQV